jgi:hypothetical protein
MPSFFIVLKSDFADSSTPVDVSKREQFCVGNGGIHELLEKTDTEMRIDAELSP